VRNANLLQRRCEQHHIFLSQVLITIVIAVEKVQGVIDPGNLILFQINAPRMTVGAGGRACAR
jgi:hypothetical protein